MSQQISPLEEIIYGLERELRIKELINVSKQQVKATPSTSLQKIEKQLQAYNDPRLKNFGEKVDRESRIRRLLLLSIDQKVNMKIKEIRQTLIEIYQLSDSRLDQLQEAFEDVHKLLQQFDKQRKSIFMIEYATVPAWKWPWSIYHYFTFKTLPLPVPPKKEEENTIISESSDDQFDTLMSCSAEKHRKKKEK